MDFQFNTGNKVDGDARMQAHFETRFRERLERFKPRLSRIEVHVRDTDGTRREGPDGIEAVIEARPYNGAPLTASDRAATPEEAVGSALQKLVARLDATFGKADRVRK
ncbi:HPF/RaiA family ribosome-associated protein [Hyphomonas sp. NPDC076900]|uniref:HPF/RaiA family ribosome-associated protein n=1 Tax=unclassified Hyphomonas TaxID=2630699 RepID=UPI003D02D964